MWRWLRSVMGVASALLLTAGPVAHGEAAATTNAALPSVLAAVAQLRLPNLVTALSSGPVPGDLALRFADGAAEVLLGGRQTITLPAPVSAARWVPGTSVIVYQRGARQYPTSAETDRPLPLAWVHPRRDPAGPHPSRRVVV